MTSKNDNNLKGNIISPPTGDKENIMVNSKKVTGKSINTYQTVMDINLKHRKSCTVLIKNTDAANDLKYKILAYVGDTYVEWLPETTIVHGASTEENNIVETPYSKVLVQIKSAVSDTPATYIAEVIKKTYLA